MLMTTLTDWKDRDVRCPSELLQALLMYTEETLYHMVCQKVQSEFLRNLS